MISLSTHSSELIHTTGSNVVEFVGDNVVFAFAGTSLVVPTHANTLAGDMIVAILTSPYTSHSMTNAAFTGRLSLTASPRLLVATATAATAAPSYTFANGSSLARAIWVGTFRNANPVIGTPNSIDPPLTTGTTLDVADLTVTQEGSVVLNIGELGDNVALSGSDSGGWELLEYAVTDAALDWTHRITMLRNPPVGTLDLPTFTSAATLASGNPGRATAFEIKVP